MMKHQCSRSRIIAFLRGDGEELFMVVDMVFYMCQVEATPKSLNSAFWYVAIFLCPSM